MTLPEPEPIGSVEHDAIGADADGFEKPDPKVAWVWFLSSSLTYGLLLLVGLALASWQTSRGKSIFWWLAVLIPLLLWVVSTLTLRKQYNAWRFRVTPDALEMEHGWLWRQRRVVARDRIQHIDINSGPIDRQSDLVQVVVHTSGSQVGMIPGLDPGRAEQLRDELIPRENPR